MQALLSLDSSAQTKRARPCVDSLSEHVMSQHSYLSKLSSSCSTTWPPSPKSFKASCSSLLTTSSPSPSPPPPLIGLSKTGGNPLSSLSAQCPAMESRRARAPLLVSTVSAGVHAGAPGFLSLVLHAASPAAALSLPPLLPLPCSR